MDADSPGIEPNIIPIATPAIIIRMEAGCKIPTNALPKSPNACIIFVLLIIIES